MRASGESELRKFSHFHILKVLFLSIFCCYFRYFVGTNDMLVGLNVPTNFQMYRQNSEKALLRGGGGGNFRPPPLWLYANEYSLKWGPFFMWALRRCVDLVWRCVALSVGVPMQIWRWWTAIIIKKELWFKKRRRKNAIFTSPCNKNWWDLYCIMCKGFWCTGRYMYFYSKKTTTMHGVTKLLFSSGFTQKYTISMHFYTTKKFKFTHTSGRNQCTQFSCLRLTHKQKHTNTRIYTYYTPQT